MVKLKNVSWKKILLGLWLVSNLSIGVLIVHQYGISIDEPNSYHYSNDALDAYPSLFGTLYEPKYSSTYDGHGPAFVIIAGMVIRVVQGMFPNVFAPDLWHFSYFVTFQLTGLCLYWLTKRWFNICTGWGILILFTTQPLLWGHAFINPKDIPFMFLFTASIVFGFRLVDGIEAEEVFISFKILIKTWINKAKGSDPQRRRRFLIHLALALTIVLTIAILSSQINSLIERVVTFFYTASPDAWAGRILSFIAAQVPNLPVKDSMVRKVLRLVHRIELVMLMTGIVFFLTYFSLLISNTPLPTFLSNSKKQVRKLGESLTSSSSLKVWFAEFIRAISNPANLYAGFVLGLATAVRSIAPLAGVIVLIYLVIKVRSKAWTIAIAYFLIAGIITFLTWPHLWGAPVQRYLESLGIASNFPWLGRVLFNGELYRTTQLPSSYLPVLLNIQLTEPFLLLFYIGLGILVWRLLRIGLRIDLLLYIGFASIFPLVGLVWRHSPLYDNFRQLLFLLPGLFVVAAFALEAIFNKLNRYGMRLALILAICLPGLVALFYLHPYQYIYYNSLVGGVRRASDRFEMDYWGTSMREMAFNLNEMAEPRSKVVVVVVGTPRILNIYTRPDLIVDQYRDTTFDLNGDYDYAVLLSRLDAIQSYPNGTIVSTVERDGTILAVIKRVKGERFR